MDSDSRQAEVARTRIVRAERGRPLLHTATPRHGDAPHSYPRLQRARSTHSFGFHSANPNTSVHVRRRRTEVRLEITNVLGSTAADRSLFVGDRIACRRCRFVGRPSRFISIAATFIENNPSDRVRRIQCEVCATFN